MHEQCYVLVHVSKAKTSLEARLYVIEELADDPRFVQDGGRFGTPVCDWFVVGGRWSGELCSIKLRSEFWQQVQQLRQSKEDTFAEGYSFIEKHQEQLDSIWIKLGGKGNSPLSRNQYRVIGEEDDACLMEGWLAKQLNVYLNSEDVYTLRGCYIKHQDWGNTPVLLSLDDCLLDNLTDFNQVVGKYWVVIIDYHC